MSDAFVESNSNVYRENVVFVTGFSIIADEPFYIGNSTSAHSNLITYNLYKALGGISGTNITGDFIVSSYIITQNILNENNGDSVIDAFNRQLLDNTPTATVDWQQAYLIPGQGISSDPSLDWRNKLLIGNWNVSGGFRISGQLVSTGESSQLILISNPITGSGTINYIPRFVSNSGIIASRIVDNGTNINIGNITAPVNTLNLLTDGYGIYSNATTQVFQNVIGGNDIYYDLRTVGDIIFRNNTNQERLRLNFAGNMGVRNPSPISTLDVSGHILSKTITGQQFYGNLTGQNITGYNITSQNKIVTNLISGSSLNNNTLSGNWWASSLNVGLYQLYEKQDGTLSLLYDPLSTVQEVFNFDVNGGYNNFGNLMTPENFTVGERLVVVHDAIISDNVLNKNDFSTSINTNNRILSGTWTGQNINIVNSLQVSGKIITTKGIDQPITITGLLGTVTTMYFQNGMVTGFSQI